MDNIVKLTFTPSSGSAYSIKNQETVNNIKISNISLNTRIDSLCYDKEVYHPCCIETDIILTSGGSLPNVTDVVNFFLSAEVQINIADIGDTGTQQGSGTVVGQNYYVATVVPTFSRKKGSNIYNIHLTIYSKDHLLKLDKYCRSYTGQKLGDHILRDKVKATQGLDMTYTPGQLSLIKYKPSSSNDAVFHEFRNPYLVQYNESFYDFIARNCNRLGEFLFFEDGKITMGLPENVNKTSYTDKNGDSKQYPYFVINDDNILTISYPTLSKAITQVGGSYYNYLTDKAAKYRGSSTAYDWDTADDEFFEGLDVDGPDTWWNGEFFWGPKFMAILNNWPKQMKNWRTWPESIGRMIGEIGLNILEENLNVLYCNKDFNKKIEDKADKQTDYYDQEEQMNGDIIYQFASNPSGNAKHITTSYTNLFSAFFQYVHTMQNEASKSTIEMVLKMNPELAALRVGERIMQNNKTYVIVSIKGSYATGTDETLTIKAVQYADNIIVPPAYELTEAPMASAQPAFVTDNADPQYMGRVRVKFPWQTEGESATPWLRMATPMASEKGGFFARPEVGDEVLVEFRNGNIQHPVVVGALYRGDRPTPHKSKYKYGGLASTKWQNNCGQAIILKNGTPKDFILGFSPALSFANSLAPASSVNSVFGAVLGKIPMATETLTNLSGGIDLSDKFGITSISTNTAKRSITIHSSLGDVTISAMTGINISAPNGNVTIEGKNVTIKAKNNIKLESGISINNERKQNDYLKKLNSSSLGGVLSGLATGMASVLMDKINNPIDMTLIRCFWEMYQGPKEGTMMFKSHRYMQLEAGSGKTSDTSTGFISTMEADPIMELTVAVQLLHRRIESEIKTVVLTYKKLSQKVAQFSQICAKAANYNISFYEDMAHLIQDIYDKNSYNDNVVFNENGAARNLPKKDFLKYLDDNYQQDSDIDDMKDIVEEYYKFMEEVKGIVNTLPMSKGKWYQGKNKKWYQSGKKLGYIPQSVCDEADNNLKTVLETAYDELDILPKNSGNQYMNTITDNAVKGTIYNAKKEVVYNLVKSLDFIQSNLNPVPELNKVKENESTWNKFVQSLELAPAKSGSIWDISALKSSATKTSTNFKFWDHNKEAQRWTPEQTGRIMVSDNPQSTLMLSKEGVWERKVNGLASLKALLNVAPLIYDIEPSNNEEEEDDENEG